MNARVESATPPTDSPPQPAEPAEQKSEHRITPEEALKCITEVRARREAAAKVVEIPRKHPLPRVQIIERGQGASR